ncbi:MAG: hypothetical protein DMF82_15600 [Acidobacteria bacterium]|nr:MAG: hypothetical protein DMF82_15600 [Acidobacteriota bacterium]
MMVKFAMAASGRIPPAGQLCVSLAVPLVFRTVPRAEVFVAVVAPGATVMAAVVTMVPAVLRRVKVPVQVALVVL